MTSRRRLQAIVVVAAFGFGGLDCKPIDDLFGGDRTEKLRAEERRAQLIAEDDRRHAQAMASAKVAVRGPGAASIDPLASALSIAAPPASAAPSPTLAASTAAPWPFVVRSAPPTLEEWNTALLAVKPLRVAGAERLGCEATTVREWLRIVCAKPLVGGGKPSGAMVMQGAAADTFTAVGDQAVSLTTRVYDGIRVRASFVWKSETHRFDLVWDRGASPPDPIAAFSPSGNGGPVGELTCVCALKLGGDTRCTAETSGADPDCERTFSNPATDCDKLSSCNARRPGVVPRCEAGTALDGHGRCRAL